LNSKELFVVLGVPPTMRDLPGEEHLEKLSEAHPRVRVERTYDIDQFAESVKQADGAIVQANFRFPSETLKPAARLQWIQLAAAGTDELGKSIVDFWRDNIRRFAEKEPLLYIVGRNSEY